VPAIPPQPAFAVFGPGSGHGASVATGLREVSADLSVLDGGGRWAVAIGFDGTAVCARFDHWGPVSPAAWAALAPATWPGIPVEAWASSLDRHTFAAGVASIRAAIGAGDVYQVNLTRRLSAPLPAGLTGPAAVAALGRALAEQHPAPFAATIVLPDHGLAVASASPERFLSRDRDRVWSSPIKGTAATPVGLGAKDRAENVMIVDLVRNDLGRVCVTGSVRPAALLDVQPHPGVWHLVSSVRGELRPDVDDADLLAATFPPGSVTGAPKLRAVRAIGELEAAPRGTYTGAIGFASPVWGAQFSVAIRTFEIAAGRIALGVGGGITADSVPMLEWRECLHKAMPLLRAAGAASSPALRIDEPDVPAEVLRAGVFETLLGLAGRPVRLADHLARLDRSCRELYRAGLPDDVAGRVLDAARTVPVGRAVLRVVVTSGLAVEVTAVPARAPSGPLDLVTRARAGGLWRHKWADRRWAAEPGLFVAADGTVLETERGNVFLVEPDGTLVTAPLRDDLLPGVTRRAVLDLARDAGRPAVLRGFDRAELLTRPAFATSSLSGAVPIHRVDGVDLPRADDVVAEFAAALIGGSTTVR
jgi:para-aminobenzoate synthetase/4-amino-4-deoxychorismate lyase